MTHTLIVDGIAREYVLHLPPAAGSAAPRPLVITFHGGGGTAKVTSTATGWSAKADAEKFIVAYPQGLRRDPTKPAGFLRNPQFWNLRAGLSHAERDDVDEVAFVRAMIDDIQSAHAIDPRRVYLCGFSNGAAMALRAAVDLSPRIAAVGAIAGHLWDKSRPPQRAIPLIFMIGERDPLAPPAGGPITSPWGRNLVTPPIAETVETWARWIGWNSARPDEQRDEPSVTHTIYRGLPPAEVHYLLVRNAGHVWPGGPPVLAERYTGPDAGAIDATDLIWSFFKRFPIPAT